MNGLLCCRRLGRLVMEIDDQEVNDQEEIMVEHDKKVCEHGSWRYNFDKKDWVCKQCKLPLKEVKE